MIRSMTGYGQGSAEGEGIRATVELRSVNHRFVDIRLRMPACIQPREREIRKAAMERIRRGRIEMTITIDQQDGGPRPATLQQPAVEALLAASQELRRGYGVEGSLDLRTLLTAPGVLQEDPGPSELTDDQYSPVEKALQEALQAFDEDRSREGRALGDDLDARLEAMRSMAARIGERADRVPEAALNKLQGRLEKLAAGVDLDPARVAQEVAILADRCDITEELVRLESHLQQAAEILRNPGDEAVGKRLDFLLQEINRETNTINSKSQDLEISREALGLKNETEKVREQVQNLE